MFMCVVNLKSVNKLDLTWKQSFLIVVRTKVVRTKVVRTKVVRTKVVRTKVVRTKVARTKVVTTKVVKTKVVRTKVSRAKVIRRKFVGQNTIELNYYKNGIRTRVFRSKFAAPNVRLCEQVRLFYHKFLECCV